MKSFKPNKESKKKPQMTAKQKRSAKIAKRHPKPLLPEDH